MVQARFTRTSREDQDENHKSKMEICVINEYGSNLMLEQDASSSFLAFDLETDSSRNLTGAQEGRIITEEHLCSDCMYHFAVSEKGRLRVALAGIPEEQEPITSITANSPLERPFIHLICGCCYSAWASY